MARLQSQSDLFLPDYSVRISARAKRLQLRVDGCGKVEVVVPKGVALRHVPDFVAEHEAWLRRTLGRIPPQMRARQRLPGSVTLAAIGGEWQVSYHHGQRTRVSDHAAATTPLLQVHGPSEARQQLALQQWLNRIARECLIPWLEEVSAEVGLPFSGATVRAQRGRWGSCSSRRQISLNRALMFMSPGAVRYLFIHELCHTVHMNHSARYWALVAQLEPDHRHYENELRHALGAIPYWAVPQ